jgi:glycosyltransferase involved in cell wall biosynthesis
MPDFHKRVSILMGSYDGAAFLGEQLGSILAQDYPHWTLTVSDDGSRDGTLGILEEARGKWGAGRLRVVRGPGRGFCANFLSLAAADPGGADYFAWSDQDDVWLPSKLSRALGLIGPFGASRPVLYCGRTRLMGRDGAELGLSPLRETPPPGFSNALVQSIAGGNTMLFNEAARRLIAKGLGLDPVSHDWWAYQIVTGAGGLAVYDPVPTILYRQHGLNLVGDNRGPLAFLRRLRKGWDNGFRSMNDRNLRALLALEDHLTPAARGTLGALVSLREGAGPLRTLKGLREHHIYRRSSFQQLALYVGLLAGRV